MLNTGLISPVQANEDVIIHNPLGKVPCLILDDDTTLFDSRVICEYIDMTSGNNTFFPASPKIRAEALKLQALGDGIIDAAIGIRYELAHRPKEKHDPIWMENQRKKYLRSLDFLENNVFDGLGGFTIGSVAIICALGYLEFRFPDDHWQTQYRKLAQWYAQMLTRKSVTDTLPEI